MIGASGAGALAALLYAVPKQEGEQVNALRQTVNINVSDAIYHCLPMNYKVFSKSGPFSELFLAARPHDTALPAATRRAITRQSEASV